MGKMKANRKFKEADERAVSAVIGVILMVAITVAIAATVYVYVSGMIGGTSKTTPTISFTVDSGTNKLVIASADASTKWSDLNITLSPKATGATSGYLIGYGGGATESTVYNATSGVAAGNVPAGTTLVAGDYVLLKSGTVNQAISVTVRYVPTNSLIGTWNINV
jgi:flagellin-like protein